MSHIKKNDNVKVITGDDRKKTGKVLRVFPEKGTALVQGVNLVWKHIRRGVNYPHGARIQKEAPIRMSHLMVVCQGCSKTTRVGKKATSDGRSVRICGKCKQPVTLEE